MPASAASSIASTAASGLRRSTSRSALTAGRSSPATGPQFLDHLGLGRAAIGTTEHLSRLKTGRRERSEPQAGQQFPAVRLPRLGTMKALDAWRRANRTSCARCGAVPSSVLASGESWIGAW